jgi:hypothetical protein
VWDWRGPSIGLVAVQRGSVGGPGVGLAVVAGRAVGGGAVGATVATADGGGSDASGDDVETAAGLADGEQATTSKPVPIKVARCERLLSNRSPPSTA